VAAEGLDFAPSTPLTLGVELELQIVNTRDCDLTRGASELLVLLDKRGHPGDVKPEITDSMVEMSTSIHQRAGPLLDELRGMRDAVVEQADRLNIAIAGGGAHPFQHWSDRHIYDRPRFRHLSELYGYLAKQFTVFGQHVHVGCANGDDALYLLHGLSRYVPHFIALSASSPYYQGVDTAFDSSRLNSISAFPLSGRAPYVLRWVDFIEFFEKMCTFGVVESMKDFYWDIRPKPEYGTVEVRLFDTPLTVETAAALAAYTQMLCRYLLTERPFALSEDIYLVYGTNRFQASRFGLEGTLIDPASHRQTELREDVLATLEALAPHAKELESEESRRLLVDRATAKTNDAAWMRAAFGRSRSLEDLVWQQTRLWRAGPTGT
jgi:glutamate---cysteine ligase / carboxylate-amine ligase